MVTLAHTSRVQSKNCGAKMQASKSINSPCDMRWQLHMPRTSSKWHQNFTPTGFIRHLLQTSSGEDVTHLSCSYRERTFFIGLILMSSSAANHMPHALFLQSLRRKALIALSLYTFIFMASVCDSVALLSIESKPSSPSELSSYSDSDSPPNCTQSAPSSLDDDASESCCCCPCRM